MRSRLTISFILSVSVILLFGCETTDTTTRDEESAEQFLGEAGAVAEEFSDAGWTAEELATLVDASAHFSRSYNVARMGEFRNLVIHGPPIMFVGESNQFRVYGNFNPDAPIPPEGWAWSVLPSRDIFVSGVISALAEDTAKQLIVVTCEAIGSGVLTVREKGEFNFRRDIPYSLAVDFPVECVEDTESARADSLSRSGNIPALKVDDLHVPVTGAAATLGGGCDELSWKVLGPPVPVIEDPATLINNQADECGLGTLGGTEIASVQYDEEQWLEWCAAVETVNPELSNLLDPTCDDARLTEGAGASDADQTSPTVDPAAPAIAVPNFTRPTIPPSPPTIAPTQVEFLHTALAPGTYEVLFSYVKQNECKTPTESFARGAVVSIEGGRQAEATLNNISINDGNATYRGTIELLTGEIEFSDDVYTGVIDARFEDRIRNENEPDSRPKLIFSRILADGCNVLFEVTISGR